MKTPGKEYNFGQLSKTDAGEDPFLLFDFWFNAALDHLGPDAWSMVLATATKEGIPSARMVLLKEATDMGFTFFTHYNSRKGGEISENPVGAIIFFWTALERQIRIEGKICKLSSKESDQYFSSRPFESQVSSLISEQSKPIPSRHFIEELFKSKIKDLKGQNIKRPQFWGGYRLIPERIEFWQGRPNRLNDRILFSRVRNQWKKERLAP